MTCALRQFYHTGCNQDFNEFEVEHSGWMLSFARNQLPQWLAARNEHAEEVVQETLTAVFETRGKASAWKPEKGAVKAWLAAMVRNACSDIARVKKNRQLSASILDGVENQFDFLEGHEDSSQPSPLAELVARESQQQVRLAISRLTETQQQLVALIFWQGMKKNEAGRRLGLSPVQVSRLLRAIRQQVGDLFPWGKA